MPAPIHRATRPRRANEVCARQYDAGWVIRSTGGGARSVGRAERCRDGCEGESDS